MRVVSPVLSTKLGMNRCMRLPVKPYTPRIEQIDSLELFGNLTMYSEDSFQAFQVCCHKHDCKIDRSGTVAYLIALRPVHNSKSANPIAALGCVSNSGQLFCVILGKEWTTDCWTRARPEPQCRTDYSSRL